MNVPAVRTVTGDPSAGRVRPIIKILAFLFAITFVGAIAVPILYPTHTDENPHGSTFAAINMLKQALNTFEVDHDRFPTTAEGLDALVHQPKGMTEWHPYLERLPRDSWERTFIYHDLGMTVAPFYDLHSKGPDGIDGTADDLYEDR